MTEESTTPAPRPKGEGLRSVASALDLLECFAVDGELGVSDLARRMGLAKSTAHRLLTTLRSRGFVEQVPETGRYRLGLHLYELGHLALIRSSLRQAALPVCRDLVQRTGLTTNLSVADGPDVVFIERQETTTGGKILSHSGRRLPAHVSSSGKVLAAWNPQLAQARKDAGFPPRASHTVRTPQEWDEVLAEVRSRGFAYSTDESYEGISTIAVPVLDGRHTALAALSFFGPTEEISTRVPGLVQLLQRAAAVIRKQHDLMEQRRSS